MGDPTLWKNFRAVRAYAHSVVDGLSKEQILKVPEGARNNILWNLGHIIFDGCDMIYRPAGLALPLPEELEPLFAAGSSPADWAAPPVPIRK